MLPTRSIPIYEEGTDDWHRFLYKASKGSIKAVDTLNDAKMAYMIAFTGDPSSPETMHLDDYIALLRERFPKICPFSSIQQFHDVAHDHGWIASAFRVSKTPRHNRAKYVALWGQSPLTESDLMNDAMLYCLGSWSLEHYIECVNHYDLDYDSLIVTTAMLYLSVTWPDT